MQSMLPTLLANHLGLPATRREVIAIAAAVRDTIGEVTDLGQADPDALADIIRRHRPRPPGAVARQCSSRCGECDEQCFLPSGHDLPRHCCQTHF